MTTTNENNGFMAGLYDETVKLLEKHTVGEIKQDSSSIENTMNLVFSNFSKISAQVARDT